MKYILLIYGEEKTWDDDYRAKCYPESAALARDLQASGQYITSSPLQSTRTAASVRVRDGETLVTNGPFAETREQLGGFFLIDAPSMEEAIAIAGRIPSVQTGTVEVRPVIELPNRPE